MLTIASCSLLLLKLTYGNGNLSYVIKRCIFIVLQRAFLTDCGNISDIMPEVSIDPMKVVEDALLEASDKKDLFVAYMSSMLVADRGIIVCISQIL